MTAAAVAWLAAGATSAGGLTAFTLNRLRRRRVRAKETIVDDHRIVSRDEWLVARKELLRKEKEHTRQRDELSRQRRELPWVRVEKAYVFDGPDGRETLADLFAGCSQLIVNHFMFAPDWKEGCPICSFRADHLDGMLAHLAHRDATLVTVSRAPFAQVDAFKRRMGWQFKWVSSYGSDFNGDYGVSFTAADLAKGPTYYNYRRRGADAGESEAPGTSVFYKDPSGVVFHTYSSYGRGEEQTMGSYMYLDLLPKGRDEDGLAFPMAWVRHHDRYGADHVVDPTAGPRAPAKQRA
jgi:predicted dithiol-disulfide oxidoreductase (DUF899 family)